MGRIQIVREGDLLVVNDASLTFMEGGGLPVSGGLAIVPGIVNLIENWPEKNNIDIIYEIHVPGTVSWASSYCLPAKKKDKSRLTFVEYDRMSIPERQAIIAPHALFTHQQLWAHLQKVKVQLLWPEHGDPRKPVEMMPHPDILRLVEKYKLKMHPKAMNPICDSYSALFDDEGNLTGYHLFLPPRGIRRTVTVGIAFDVCAGYTSIGFNDLGYESYIVKDLTASVSPELEKAMIKRLKGKVTIINQDDIEF